MGMGGSAGAVSRGAVTAPSLLCPPVLAHRDSLAKPFLCPVHSLGLSRGRKAKENPKASRHSRSGGEEVRNPFPVSSTNWDTNFLQPLGTELADKPFIQIFGNRIIILQSLGVKLGDKPLLQSLGVDLGHKPFPHPWHPP